MEVSHVGGPLQSSGSSFFPYGKSFGSGRPDIFDRKLRPMPNGCDGRKRECAATFPTKQSAEVGTSSSGYA